MIDRDERRRIRADIRQLLGEALTAPSLCDNGSELAVLGMQLDDEQRRLDKLMHDDPIRVIWFGPARRQLNHVARRYAPDTMLNPKHSCATPGPRGPGALENTRSSGHRPTPGIFSAQPRLIGGHVISNVKGGSNARA